MQKRLVTRYAMKSADTADENQRRVEAVFTELDQSKPDNVSYLVLRLADDSFLHVSFHDHRDDEVNFLGGIRIGQKPPDGRLKVRPDPARIA